MKYKYFVKITEELEETSECITGISFLGEFDTSDEKSMKCIQHAILCFECFSICKQDYEEIEVDIKKFKKGLQTAKIDLLKDFDLEFTDDQALIDDVIDFVCEYRPQRSDDGVTHNFKFNIIRFPSVEIEEVALDLESMNIKKIKEI